MEEECTEKSVSSYRYWVRGASQDAVPLPEPRKLTADELTKKCADEKPNDNQSKPLGSVWNQAGTWEEKNLNGWASLRIKELVMSIGPLELASGAKAEISELSKCVGDAFLVTVRKKKRVGYNYELTLKVKGEWVIGDEKKSLKAHLDIPDFSFGELDDLQLNVRVSEEKELSGPERLRICQDLNLFLQPLRQKLLQFETELKDR